MASDEERLTPRRWLALRPSSKEVVDGIRSASDVAERCLALVGVVGRAVDQDGIAEWVSVHNINRYFSPEESSFFAEDPPTQSQKIDASWRAEALVALLWGLREIDELPAPHEIVNLRGSNVLLEIRSAPSQFVTDAELRAPEEILEVEEEYYGYHWQVRDAQLHGHAVSEELDAVVVIERRYALSWMNGDGDEWDDVPTDT